MKNIIVQAVKFGVVGVMNTAVTAVVIFVMMELLGYPDILSNAVGYVAGVLNSFVWNHRWTFHSNEEWISSAVRFLCVFVVCYLFQLVIVEWVLNPCLPIKHYYNHLIGMGFYTALNFILNKYFTFRA